MGRGGLYFRHSLNHTGQRHRHAPTQQALTPSDDSSDTVGQFQEIESGSTLKMVDGSSAVLLRELNEKRKRPRLLPVVVLCGVFTILVLFANQVPLGMAWASIAGIVLLSWLSARYDTLRKTTVILYELDSDVEAAYQTLHDAFDRLRECGRVWHMEATAAVRDPKYHAGASNLVRRKAVTLKKTDPPYVKTNIEVPLVPVGRQTLAFLPDRVLVFEPTTVGAIRYADLSFERMQTQCVESDSVPQDATVVGKTWAYVNKKGGPDKRFKNNRELPICVYELMHFSSGSGLNEIVQASRSGAGEPLSTALGRMRQLSFSDVLAGPQ
jgi:hypothetical protein